MVRLSLSPLKKGLEHNCASHHGLTPVATFFGRCAAGYIFANALKLDDNKITSSDVQLKPI